LKRTAFVAPTKEYVRSSPVRDKQPLNLAQASIMAALVNAVSAATFDEWSLTFR
jgi:hypothetical protein